MQPCRILPHIQSETSCTDCCGTASYLPSGAPSCRYGPPAEPATTPFFAGVNLKLRQHSDDRQVAGYVPFSTMGVQPSHSGSSNYGNLGRVQEHNLHLQSLIHQWQSEVQQLKLQRENQQQQPHDSIMLQEDVLLRDEATSSCSIFSLSMLQAQGAASAWTGAGMPAHTVPQSTTSFEYYCDADETPSGLGLPSKFNPEEAAAEIMTSESGFLDFCRALSADADVDHLPSSLSLSASPALYLQHTSYRDMYDIGMTPCGYDSQENLFLHA
jgi:hypothetical protein